MDDAAARARQILEKHPRAKRVAIERDTLAALLPPQDETDEWDGEGACPKCQGDGCDPEGGCVHDD